MPRMEIWRGDADLGERVLEAFKNWDEPGAVATRLVLEDEGDDEVVLVATVSLKSNVLAALTFCEAYAAGFEDGAEEPAPGETEEEEEEEDEET